MFMIWMFEKKQQKKNHTTLKIIPVIEDIRPNIINQFVLPLKLRDSNSDENPL